MSSKIVVCGSIAIDRIMNFDGLYKDLVEPDKLDVFSISVLIDELHDSKGGTGANIAHHIALLGEDPVLIGSVGHNAKGYMNQLEKTGVDITNVHYSDSLTASFTVLNDKSSAQVGGFYVGAMKDSDTLNVDGFTDEDVIVIISAHDPVGMKKQVAQCAENNIRLVYDVSQQLATVDAEDIIEGVAAAEVIIVNEYEMALMARKTGLSEDELKKTVPVFITTHGAKGSVINGSNVKDEITISIAKPDVVVDPTGAGDGYRSGFLYGYARGWDLKKCSQLGAVIASYVVENFGSQVQFTEQMILDRYKQNFNEGIEL